jgi:WD40 repeat protein
MKQRYLTIISASLLNEGIYVKRLLIALLAIVLLLIIVVSWEVMSHNKDSFSTGGAEYISQVAFSPNGLLFAATMDTTVQIWTTADRRRVTEINRGWQQKTITWSPDSQRIAIDGPDGIVDVYDPTTGMHLGSFKNPDLKQGNIIDLAWSAQNQIAIGYVNNQVDIIDGSTYRIQHMFVLPPHSTAPWNGVNAVDFTSDGTLLAAGSRDGHIRVWRMVDGSLVHDLSTQNQTVIALAFNPTGTLLASGGDAMVIDLWDVPTGVHQAMLMGHSASIRSVAFLPDGQRLVSGSGPGPETGAVHVDASVRLWDITTQHLITILGNHRSRVLDVATSPDGQSITSSGLSDGIKLWKTP